VVEGRSAMTDASANIVFELEADNLGDHDEELDSSERLLYAYKNAPINATPVIASHLPAVTG
jgi:hypothetical protein